MGQIPFIAYLAAAVCFIFSLGGLSRHETARRGNWLGIAGIVLAVLATFFTGQITGGYVLLGIGLCIGATIGVMFATRVEMTAMPELVAILHSFVGVAAVLVGISNYCTPHPQGMAELLEAVGGSAVLAETARVEAIIHKIEIFLGVFIGGVTFTGSVVAWGKLNGRFTSKPVLLPGRHWLNAAILVLCALLGWWFLATDSFAIGLAPLLLMTLLSFVLGVHLVVAIGGADMPVVVSMLNSYSGWAAAATGFLLENDLLIVTGALVGSSGAILSYIMCRAMNRSFLSVILGGFGTEGGSVVAAGDRNKSHTEIFADEVAQNLLQSQQVVVIPGYGMAVAQAQHAVREIADLLRKRGIKTRFAIHPVAGRLPGHMNVLLAEANVPYDIVLEMDEINEDFPQTDVVLVIGANDIVNPAALDDPGSPIYGMPVLEAWKAGEVVVLKRSMATGYSGIDNPLFYLENTRMLFGDAKASVEGVLRGLRDRVAAAAGPLQAK
jgi:NAD(P) transhydrogenase subunit beta